jgi:hypothetical protein
VAVLGRGGWSRGKVQGRGAGQWTGRHGACCGGECELQRREWQARASKVGGGSSGVSTVGVGERGGARASGY